ncbi:dolichyl pyrophosphate Glc1Man9GlcNAc2 alpha-1,3-glucosyltransferase-like [Tubulanus polymorphus]|uniref:dolichyl pyrophosphate Glc1Man9GlcNAc2 alpha-1,3-glucosyltransferase-like n=1 Tax=Tubulanus polymorphus TaxID=672921 RepID=UPI003DA464A5
MEGDSWFWAFAGVMTCFKFLLVDIMPSTDFEVHRNWLAITHSLPLKEFYIENSSKSPWTLDYPPFFAYFERFLSLFARFFDREMLSVHNLDHLNTKTVLFQKITVIVTDFVFIYAVKILCNDVLKFVTKKPFFQSQTFLASVLLVGNIGLLMVDHMHFQYNGFLYGIMLLSIIRIFQGNMVEAAVWFSVLLNFKHIYLYVAPAYFVYMLRKHCFMKNQAGVLEWMSESFERLVQLGAVVVGIFALSFGPFILKGQLKDVLARLFPFKRGLTHAYWAPNFWALYNFIDKVLTFVGVRIGRLSPEDVLGTASGTDGKVKDIKHTVLPCIPPVLTLILTVSFIIFPLVHLWKNPTGPRSFLRCLVLCAFGSFLFGWHVHEKAILLISIPLTILALLDVRDVSVFLIISTVGHYSLFPLLLKSELSVIKVSLLVLYTIMAFKGLSLLHEVRSSRFCLPFLNFIETVYVLGLVPLYVYTDILHNRFNASFTEKYEFLPLMLTSTYCAMGVVYSAVKYLYYVITMK